MAFCLTALASACNTALTTSALRVPVTVATPETATSNPTGTAMSWQNYTDTEDGITFQYPATWGSVAHNDGNRSDEGSACQTTNPLSGTVQDQLVSPIFDSEYTFSRQSIVLHVLTGLDKHPVISYCAADGTGLDTSLERETLSTKATPVALRGGLTAYEYPLTFLDTADYSQDNAADVFVNSEFVLYHRAARYEITVTTGIAGETLQEAGCLLPDSATGDRHACAQVWLENDPGAQYIRTLLSNLKQMVQTLSLSN